MKKNQIKVTSPNKYRVKTEKGYQRIYRFPFETLDPTPGGSNLGRMEWGIELFRAKKKQNNRYYIEKIWVWARQTRDKRYLGKVFEIPCWTEMIESLDRVFGEPGTDPYMSRVWQTAFCSEHKQVSFSAYPDTDHNVLEIDVQSSIMASINFKTMKNTEEKLMEEVVKEVNKVSKIKCPKPALIK